MAGMTTGSALRLLEQAQAGLRKARGLLREVRGGGDRTGVFRAGWLALREAHRLMAAIEVEAAREPVLTRHLAVSRYATALLVRLRRLERAGEGPLDEELDRDDEAEA